MTKLDDILTFDEVAQILRIIEAAPRGGDINIQLGDASLHLRLAGAVASSAHHGAVHPPIAPATATPSSATTAGTAASSVAPSAAGRPSPTAAADIDRGNWVAVKSPMVGIFYRAPSPGDPPFVEIGDPVEEGQQIGIIEVMKLMNRISAPCNGVVREVCVENAQLAGFDAPLIWIEPGA